MEKDEHLQRHLDLCRRMHLRMLSDGSWPWKEDEKQDPDSPKSENLLDSGNNSNVP